MEETVTTSPSQVLQQIDAELRALWSTPPEPGEMPKARACTRNLVVVAGTPEVAERWLEVIDDVLTVIPARAIVVGLDLDGADGLEAEATAVCTPGESGGPAVCSERVKLVARGGTCARLASCVQTLCGSDVPTTLVWLGRVHADDPVFAPLASDADRVVLDAGQGSLAGLAQVVRWAGARALEERPGVTDLAWARLAPWHELCARLFDEPRLRGLASRVTRVSIVQASAPGAPLGSEGGLMLGWLATRLGWKATSLAGRLRLVRPGDGTVRAHLCADPSAAAPRGTLLGVELEAAVEAADGFDSGRSPSALATDGLGMRGSVRLDPKETDSATWQLDVTSGGETRHIEQRVRLRATEPARLLETSLRRPAHDDVLAESVIWADELRGEELACG
jgi:glucose-6-phosphate dehydrogenase assembly protein OpcA